jgi:hypothetical protein
MTDKMRLRLSVSQPLQKALPQIAIVTPAAQVFHARQGGFAHAAFRGGLSLGLAMLFTS